MIVIGNHSELSQGSSYKDADRLFNHQAPCVELNIEILKSRSTLILNLLLNNKMNIFGIAFLLLKMQYLSLLLFCLIWFTACDEGKYGPRCKLYCKCQNNAKCDHVMGTCTCLSGYTGRVCETGQ